MRCRGPRALSVPARLDHDDGLRARGGAGRRHELAGVGDRLDVEQDRTGGAVSGEIVEAVTEIDIDHVAERHESREADPAPRRPLEKPCLDGAGLRDQCEIARHRVPRRKAGVELRPRRDDAKAVRSDEAQAVLARLQPYLFGERAGAMPEPGGDDERCGDSLATSACDNPGDCRRRRRDDNQIRDLRQILNPRHARLAVNLAVFRVNEQNRPGKPCLP